MLRSAIARSGARAGRGFAPRTQWQFRRTFADAPPDRTVLPGSQSASAAGVPQAPVLGGNPPPPQQAAASQVPKEPPPPPSSSTPPKPRRRFRKFLLTMFLLTTLGYGGGVWYSLQSDNFHDFFTEFVPYGEDVVAYFEEREFRKRFPVKEYNDNKWQQIRGENKVTIGRQSGVEPKATEKSGSSASSANKVQEGAKPQPEKAQQTPAAASEREKTQAVESAKKSEDVSSAAKAAPAVDHVNIAQATKPVVQNLVNMVNGVIAAVNASPEDASKYSSTIQTMKNNVEKVISDISTMKDSAAQEAEQALKNAHTEFDSAAKELVRRLEQELRAQEGKWREEYESERERLSSTYQDRLRAELEAAEKVSEEKNKNALLEQEIALQKAYMQTVADKVEAERNGRLAKIDALSESVGELDKLTGEWNQVLDATIRTQHLQIAVEAVRAKVLESEYPTPFLNELVALKEVSGEDEVVNAAIASINPLAYQRGIPSPASLIERFRRVASEVRKASLLPEDAGVASHAASAVLSRMMFAKKSDRGLPEGDDVEATLARTEVLLEEGDLDAAAREMNGLKGWAGVLSRDWVGECRRVLEVRQAVEVIATEARLQSLLVE
ncbi:hypothetical protein KC351_g12621 [Hortaea werneckii]|nr:hypothetical protein KC351_g12621 [Hortaea werneckii]